ncbi:hypothetical protein SAMN04488058_101325 [Deinococcus reticulitermitis]|uniref:ASCH domain-containing protein n=1 Tax=Deinococcus reticulitermitis TaxID=856736 RepID=A0A1H6STG8_9DEIO|nr:hypothetical protein [Deinococcus reticulitermitis]SEI68057.1 hypothetical protein SAMN04488058_101325 [Deinococcus reticulitermitis]
MSLTAYLSLSRPWTVAIERHGKRVENRHRWAGYAHLLRQAERHVGQDIALHSSGSYSREDAGYIKAVTGVWYARRDVPDKALTSVVRIAGLLHPGDACPPGQERWYFGGFALVLDNVRVLPTPVDMPGALGFQKIPEPQLSNVLAQLGALKGGPQ